ncbi:MCE family protein [Aeromicrobium sp.]|uniref:MCE family protein n=1 Tax=Aeromicrobium sp. TaxID=1871063 RepID=UPI0030BCC119
MTSALFVSGCSFDIYDVPLPGNKVSADNSFEISADFADALNVVPRSSVLVADVPVGQVESVTRVGWRARVKMRIRKDVVLPDNAEAEIRQTSLLGEKFVELSAPPPVSDSGAIEASTGRLGSGDVIPMDSTGRNPEVEEVLGALSYLLSGGGVGQLQTITSELNEIMEGRTGEIRGVLNKLNTFVGMLDTQRGDIVQALESVNGLSKTLVAEKDTIGEAIEAAAPAITVLRDQHDELVGVLTELDKLGEVGTRVVDKIKDDLVAELGHLEPVLRELADTGDSLVPGAVAAASYPFPIDAADTIRGDFANVVFKMQFKLTPISEGGLLPTTLDDLTTLCRATPAAPICAPGGDAVEQFCKVLASLPLCAAPGAAGTGQAQLGVPGPTPTDPLAPVEPLLPRPSQGSGGGGSPVDQLLRGLLGGGSS